MDSIFENLNKLATLEDPVPVLMDIKFNLSAVLFKDIKSIFATKKNLQTIKPLFDVLNSSDSDQVLLCAEILNIILTNVDHRSVLCNLQEEYLRGFEHPNENIRVLILKQLLMYCEEGKCQTIILEERPLLHMVLRSLGDKSLEVVKYAHKVLMALSSLNKEVNNVETVMNCGGAAVLKNVMKISDSSRFHVYDYVVKVSVLDEKILLHMASLGFIPGLLNEMSTGDVLTQLNALELLSELATNSNGLRYLQAAGIITKLSYLLSTSRNDSMTAILLPGILKFFGNLGSIHPQLLAEDESGVLTQIMKAASDVNCGTEASIQLIAFETLTHIGVSVEGKHALLKYTVEMENTLKDLSSHFKSFSTDMQVKFLDAIAELFSLKKEDHSDDLCSRMELWFEHLSPESSMKFIYDIAKLPFPDLVCSSLRVMKSLTGFPWAVIKMAQEPGFISWLVDRNSCREKASKELQWEVIGVLRSDQFAKEYFSEEICSKFSKYYEQGPFYVEAEHSVAFEGES